MKIKILIFLIILLQKNLTCTMTIFGKGGYIEQIAAFKKVVASAEKNIIDNDFESFQENNKKINDIIDIIEKYATQDISKLTPLRAYLASENFFPSGDKNIFGDDASKFALTRLKESTENQRNILIDKLKNIFDTNLHKDPIVAHNIYKFIKDMEDMDKNLLIKQRFNLEKLYELKLKMPYGHLFKVPYYTTDNYLNIYFYANMSGKDLKNIIWHKLKNEHKLNDLRLEDLLLLESGRRVEDGFIFSKDDIKYIEDANYPVQIKISPPLESVSRSKNFNYYLELAKKNNEINRRNPFTGQTTLTYTISQKINNPDLIKQLFEAGADPFIKDKQNKNFFDYLNEIKKEEYKKYKEEVENIVKQYKENIKKELLTEFPKEIKEIVAQYLV